MTRRWRFLMFPNSTGMFIIPPLTAQILTAAGVRRELRCEQRALMVQAADASVMQSHAPPSSGNAPADAARQSLPFIGIAAHTHTKRSELVRLFEQENAAAILENINEIEGAL